MQNVFGGLMLGCGILIAGLSGICTLLVVGTSFIDPNNAEKGEIFTALPAVLVIAGIPFAIGLGLFFGGRALMNSASSNPPAPTPPQEIKPAKPPQDGGDIP